MESYNLRVPRTAELVAERLRRQIVRGQLLEGHAFPPEAVLMDDLGVSRPTLREAFRVLESEGLIQVRRGSHGGARVRVPTDAVVARYASLVLEHRQTTIADIGTGQVILETASAVAIADRHDPHDLARLRDAVEAAETITDPVDQLAAQRDFHRLLVVVAGNQTITLLHGAVQQIIDRALVLRAERAAPEADAARHLGAPAHRRFVELLTAGDVPLATELWRHHITETNVYLQHEGKAARILDLLE